MTAAQRTGRSVVVYRTHPCGRCGATRAACEYRTEPCCGRCWHLDTPPITLDVLTGVDGTGGGFVRFPPGTRGVACCTCGQPLTAAGWIARRGGVGSGLECGSCHYGDAT